ncbi:Molecular chaperone [Globisporangium polare]
MRSSRPKLKLLLVLLLALALVGHDVSARASSGAYQEDPYKVLGVSRQASESEIKRAYRQLALKWHPDKNPGNPKAESEFMRIGSAYERLVNGDTGGGGNGYRQQNPYSRQYHQQQDFYRQQQQYQQYPVRLILFASPCNSPFPFSFMTLAICGFLVWIFIILPSQKEEPATNQQSQSSSSSSSASANAKPEEPRPSPLEQLAKVFAPSIYAFNPIYLNARGRRMLLFFLDNAEHGCSVREQLSIIESLAVEFQRDPLTFCWIDLSSRTAHERKKWSEQFGGATPSFVVACSAKGRKISMHLSGSKAAVTELRQWITRLLGGEIAQRETIPELFG